MKTEIYWPVAPAIEGIGTNDVHLWVISVTSVSELVADLASLLSSEERQRAARFKFERDRIRFIATRAVLRTILGSYLDEDPRRLRFAYGINGKPELAGSCELKFNLSHAEDVVLFAIANDRELGVDVEKLRDFSDMDDVASRFFLPEEIGRLRGFEGVEKRREFYRFWTRGEALLKWSGNGIVEPEYRKKIAGRFNGIIHDLKPALDYVAAIAVEGEQTSLVTSEWPQGCEIPCGRTLETSTYALAG